MTSASGCGAGREVALPLPLAPLYPPPPLAGEGREGALATSTEQAASPSPTLPRKRGRGSKRAAHLTCASERVHAANRANAARSTGPRTRAGKQRSARNALRHGLNQPVLAAPGLAAEVAGLARRIAGEDASARRRAAARGSAEAQVDIQRIHCVREQIMI